MEEGKQNGKMEMEKQDFIMDNGKIIKLLVMVNIIGQIKENT